MAGKKGRSGRPVLDNKPEMIQVSFKIPKDLHKKLVQEAYGSGHMLSGYLRRIILKHFDI